MILFWEFLLGWRAVPLIAVNGKGNVSALLDVTSNISGLSVQEHNINGSGVITPLIKGST